MPSVVRNACNTLHDRDLIPTSLPCTPVLGADALAAAQFNRLRFGVPPLGSRFPMSKKSPNVTLRFEPTPAPRERSEAEERVLCRPGWEV